MKGDFSKWQFEPSDNFTGVLFQQGRVDLDSDNNAETQIDDYFRKITARDVIGAGVAGIPANSSGGFKVVAANVTGSNVSLTLTPGRVWADGVHFLLPSSNPLQLPADYLSLPPPNPPGSVQNNNPIAAGVRDAVVLDVWEESINAYQEPVKLLEPALGGPDTTERIRVCAALKLMRLGPNDDCSAVARAADNFSAKGKLNVTLTPVTTVTGDCPVDLGGGYAGFEHYLYRIEIADPLPNKPVQFKWSQFNGALVGRGKFDSATNKVTIDANDQMITQCGLTGTKLWFEALATDNLGVWRVTMSADAVLGTDGVLQLDPLSMIGTWPASSGTVPTSMSSSFFFRLWNGIRPITDFPAGPNTMELKDGIRLVFDAPATGNTNYTPGDYWTFPVRAAGALFTLPLLTQAPPQGVHHHRVALAILKWTSTTTAEIDDCRRIFPALTDRRGCCTYVVGDGVTTHGDFDSIEDAIDQMPSTGGEICLLPGLHQTNAVIQGRQNIRIHGCRTKTKVVPRPSDKSPNDPIFHIVNSTGIALERMDMIALKGSAIVVEGTAPGKAAGIEIADNRILAWEHAVSVTNGAEVTIHDNDIRMIDKDGGEEAIYLAADDSLIERNDIRLMPAQDMPPMEIPPGQGPGGSYHPSDPCAGLTLVYANPRFFRVYVDRVWEVLLSHIANWTQAHRALGGIRIGGGSERVRVLDNLIEGGAGNGITLGDDLTDTMSETSVIALPEVVLPNISDISVSVLGPSGQTVNTAHITLTPISGTGAAMFDVSNGSYELQQGDWTNGGNRVDASAPGLVIDTASFTLDPPPNTFHGDLRIVMKPAPEGRHEPSGFLYDISIKCNRINGMGRSGIGMLPIGAANATKIAHETGGMTYRNPLTGVSSRVQGDLIRMLIGTPVIGLDIYRNRIENCLQNPFNMLSAEVNLRGLGGISLGLCEDVTIAENRIEKSGTTAVNPTCGIFIFAGSNVEIVANYVLGNGPATELSPDLSLNLGWRGGIVLNYASSFFFVSPDSTSDGAINISNPGHNARPAARLHGNIVDQPAGLALYLAAIGPVSCTANSFNSELAGPSEVEQGVATIYVQNLGGPTRRDSSEHAWPSGPTLFSDNQSRMGAANKALWVSQSFDIAGDLGYHDNQSQCDCSVGPFLNVSLQADTLRAVGNRCSEAGSPVCVSLATYAIRLNNTSLNQGDNGVSAGSYSSAAQATVELGNQRI